MKGIPMKTWEVRALYGWEANPWVWVIEFERISREEAEDGLQRAD